MRTLIKTLVFAALVLALGFGSALFLNAAAQTQEDDPRQTEIVVSVTEYSWWLTRWKNNEITCTVGVEHEGIPTALEVLADCGQTLYREWIATPPCAAAAANGNTSTCPGLYIFFVQRQTVEKNVKVELPEPTAWLTLLDCSPTPTQARCETLPSLVITAEEPLPNEAISSVHIYMDGRTIDCEGSRCEVPLHATDVEGDEIEFWADSTFGDATERYTARLRVLDGGVPTEGNEGGWFVDVISSQFLAQDAGSCAAIWEAFPPIGEPPHWLTTPADHTGLASDAPFVYLAAELINNQIVDASGCADHGLLAHGVASPCGVEAARQVVNDWQDQFDHTIFEAAVASQIPAQLLKNIFAQESQFWPGYAAQDEFGLGQLTEDGADTPLLWNVDFFNQFCPLVLHEETCATGYAKIFKETPQYAELLRGALAAQSTANCPDCDFGIDLAHAQSTVDIFAQTIKAHCSQVAFIVSDITKVMPGEVSSYEDLWRFTLASYNAGPKCLAVALNNAWRQGRMDWETVSNALQPACRGAIEYVDRITKDRLPSDADFVPTFTPTPTFTPGPTNTPAPATGTPTPGATATQPGYPPAPTNTPFHYPPPATPTPGGYP
jgi:hypothetical protein